jgi:hypothetical protein
MDNRRKRYEEERRREFDMDDDWASRVPDHSWRGEYGDYGWERGESWLPEFRDPSVHLTREERQRLSEDERRYRELAERRARSGRRPYWDVRQEERYQAPRFDENRMRWDDERDFSPQGYYQEGGYGRGFNEQGQFSVRGDWSETGPYRGMGPRNYVRSDERIYEEVCERLTRHGQVDASEIEIEVKDGEITLNGTVNTRREKRMAEDALETVSGMREIHNRLRVHQRQDQGQNWTDRVGHSGIYPASGPMPEGDAEVQGMASWGQGERGAEGYEDHGDSELHIGRQPDDE